jgi:tetratricopeptide (TPR) repeat protein
LLKEGLARFPGDDALQIQLARIYAYQHRDRQALGLLNAALLRNPDNREAKLELAHVYGYRLNYTQSDRLYRELLAADANDEAASLGLVHNLILEGKKAEARQEVQRALARHPTSLGLQQYSDYLAKDSGTETRRPTNHRAQATESFFADTSGNRSFYSAQGLTYKLGRTATSRFRLEETSLWRTGTNTVSVLSGADEIRMRLNQYVAVRAGAGAIRFADSSSEALYSGDLELYPWKSLLVSGGFSRYPILPTWDAAQFDLLSEGWHGRVDYRTRDFSLAGTFYLTHYSDSNRSEREWAETLRWFGPANSSFGVAAGYAFRHLHYARDPNHGYFSPSQYHSHLAAAGVRFRVGKFYRAEYLGYGGIETLRNLDSSPAGELLLKNDFVWGRWDLAADYSYFHVIQATGAFRANAVSATLGYKF